MIGNLLCMAAKNSVKFVAHHSPLILSVTGIGCGIASTAMAIKVTPEANDILKKINENDILTPKEKKIEIVKNVIPLYGPAILTGSMGAGAVIASYGIHHHRLKLATEQIAGLSTAYLFANEQLKDYKQSIVDKFGENVEKEVEQTALEKGSERSKTKIKDIIIANDSPDELMQDGISGQYFKGRRSDIYLIFNEIQKRLQVEDAIPASEYFYEADIDACGLGDSVGWICGSEPWPSFTEFLLPDGRKAVRVDVDTDPQFLSYRQYY